MTPRSRMQTAGLLCVASLLAGGPVSAQHTSTGADPAWRTGRERTGQIERGELPPPIATPDLKRQPPAFDHRRSMQPEAAHKRPAQATGRRSSDIWQGVTIKMVEDHLSAIGNGPRSATMRRLQGALWLADAVPSEAVGNPLWQAIRIEALLRAGRLEEAHRIHRAAAATPNALLDFVGMRVAFARADKETACGLARRARAGAARLPEQARRIVDEAFTLCLTSAATPEAAGLALDLAREAGVEAPLAFSVLEASAQGGVARIAVPTKVGPLEHRILALLPLAQAAPLIARALERADLPLQVALASDDATPSAIRIVMGEAAAREHAFEPAALAAVYASAKPTPADVTAAIAGRGDPRPRRAALLAAVGDPARRAAALPALLAEAQSVDLSLPIARLAVEALRSAGSGPGDPTLAAAPAAAEALAELLVITGDGVSLVALAQHQQGRLDPWRALADIADPSSEARARRVPALAVVERMALGGRFVPAALHRVATVLDALDDPVPIPLWEAASRTSQPTTGHLPPTGILPALADAARAGRHAEVIMLAARALGPEGPAATNLLALGDTIKALRIAGLTSEARALALEALLPIWPRTGRPNPAGHPIERTAKARPPEQHQGRQRQGQQK